MTNQYSKQPIFAFCFRWVNILFIVGMLAVLVSIIWCIKRLCCIGYEAYKESMLELTIHNFSNDNMSIGEIDMATDDRMIMDEIMNMDQEISRLSKQTSNHFGDLTSPMLLGISSPEIMRHLEPTLHLGMGSNSVNSVEPLILIDDGDFWSSDNNLTPNSKDNNNEKDDTNTNTDHKR